MMVRGEVALIVAQKGLAVGMVKAEYFAPVILLIIVSSMVVPILLGKAFSEKKTATVYLWTNIAKLLYSSRIFAE